MAEVAETNAPTIVARTGLGLVMVIALLVLGLGWAQGVGFFIRIRSDFAAMVPSTAISFFLLGAGLLTLTFRPRSGVARSAGTAAALAVAAIAILDIAVLVSGEETGIDSWFWPLGAIPPGDAMAGATALLFLLAVVCSLHLAWPNRHTSRVFLGSSTVGLALSLTAMVAYLFDSEALYSVFFFTAMALHTALAFAILFLTLMAMDREHGWIWLLFGDGAGTQGARRLVPYVVAGPFLLCVLAYFATQGGLLNANFRLSILAIAMVLIGACGVLRNAALGNRAEAQVNGLMADLESALADRSLLLREVYHRVKNNLQQINALLAIERRRLDDPNAIAAFQAMSGRVQALGMVHQLLIQSTQPSQVNVRDFIEELTQAMVAGQALQERGIDVSVDAAPDTVHIDLAMTLGLLANELATNAIKHAFPDGRKGTIRIEYGNAVPGEKRLTVRDDGKGYSSGDRQGTGWRIIEGLVRQLKGRLDVSVSGGTAISIIFPEKPNQENRYVDS